MGGDVEEGCVKRVWLCIGCGVELGPDAHQEYERCPICGIFPAGWTTVEWLTGEKPADPNAELTLGLTA